MAKVREGKPLKGEQNATLSLICRVGTRLCAVPIGDVVETMRPLPIEPFAGAPTFVSGLAIIRGEPVPVVNAALVLGAEDSQPTRFVTVKVGMRRVALAVDSVFGVNAISRESLEELPPLFRDANSEIISAIGSLDAELLVVLRGARLVPESLWSALDAARESP